MTQHDYNIANADGATVRADLNSLFQAIAEKNSGATAPTTTFPFMSWFDTANSLLKMRNAANTAWVTVASLSGNVWLSRADVGTVGAPAFAFSADPDTGLYRSAADTLAAAVGGVQGLTLDANGLTLPLNPAFLAYRSSSGVTIATGATSKITFNSEAFDIGGNYDVSTNHRFVAPVAGKYHFDAGVQAGGWGSTSGGRFSLYLYLNGSLKGEFARLTAAAGQSLGGLFSEIPCGGSIALDLAASDYVEIFAYQTSGATITTNYGTNYYVYFSGHRVA